MTFLVVHSAIRIGFCVAVGVMLLLAIVNFALLIKKVGWSGRKRNLRVHVHVINSALLVAGMSTSLSQVVSATQLQRLVT
jgi:Ni/Fe-hydrogenase subunit HybB-like protein